MTRTPPAVDALPIDPDLDETVGKPARPVHLRASSLAVVFVGGTLGVAARESLTFAFPAPGGIPWPIIGINLSGALLLGVLLAVLAHRGPDHGRRRTLRLLLGTGLIGGYTTYSALATDMAALIARGAITAGVTYGVATVALGGLATWTGVIIGGAMTNRSKRSRPR